MSTIESPCRVVYFYFFFAPILIMLLHIPFIYQIVLWLCWCEFSAPDECNGVFAICTRRLPKCDGEQDQVQASTRESFSFLRTTKDSFWV